MYTSFFGLNEKPFSITPNPRYLYMSERHTEALAHLIYGIKDSGGFIQLTGEVGTGKTTLIRGLLQRLPDNADIALILNPQLSATEFLGAILEELGVEIPAESDSRKALTAALNHYLLENYSKGRRTILIVDEAQNFAVDVLEQIRLLTNLETAKHKLLQITLIGQPELRTMLARNDLRQLAQRITARYHLEPLSQADTEEYVGHRLRVAGATRNVFTSAACRELYRLSGGIPRIINVLADRALLGAFTHEAAEVTPALVRKAASEVYGEDTDSASRWSVGLRVAAVAGLAALLIGAAIATALRFSAPTAPQAAAQPDDSLDAATAIMPAAGVDDLEGLLLTNAAFTDTRSAFATLFGIWGVEFRDTATPACDQAREYQLACFFNRGSIAQVRRLDRPAILTLNDIAGTPHQIVLRALDDTVADISLGGTLYQVSVAELSRLWLGEYLLLWRPQLGAVKAFVPGMEDPDVGWLRQSLALIQGRPIDPMNSNVYDEELEARVRDYQIERRIDVDGMAGQQTQILMNSDLDIGAPRLARAD
ncbi:MAG: AAA family ATPase [Gammaproteobacteria bacterium]|jgi:general secretion pathway protein A|nr:AAA family ATPase [Gammaproteobacteria bacterium]